ncbi:MAG: cation-translocating P-type ATPase C-terminal domain-containing protein [Demequina sp.]|nr:cation-translocating P-type ATPase C-terminal domain-containing protein [Demequina sp.]
MALTPIQVLVLNFAVAIFAVIVIIMEPEQSGLMQRPPRNVNQGIASGKNIVRWLLYGAVLFLVSFAPLWIFGDDLQGANEPSYPVTMTYVIMAFGTLGTAIALRRDPDFGFKAPWGKAMQLQIWPVLFIIASTELGFLQRWIGTTSLSPNEWLICIVMTLIVVGVVVGDTALRRKKPASVAPTVQEAVEPARAR